MDSNIINLHDGHRERLRLRVEYEGIESLKPHEIIEFLLCYSIPRQDVNLLAHDLIDYFGDLDILFHADAQELAHVEGIGSYTAETIMRIGEMLREGQRSRLKDRPRLNNYLETFRYIAQLKHAYSPQRSIQLCLDHSCRLIYQREITPSLAWGEPATLRDALDDMLMSHASHAVIVQLTGNRRPGIYDYDLRHIDGYACVLHAAGCSLLDVLLADEYEYFSLRREGRIPTFECSSIMRALHETYLTPEEEEQT